MKKELEKEAAEINKHIGSRLCDARITASLNRSEFGRKLGITSYQIAKYENGINKLSVDKLILIAKVLSVDLNYFLKDIKPVEWNEQQATDFMLCLRLSNNFRKITNRAHRSVISKLVKIIVEKTDNQPETTCN